MGNMNITELRQDNSIKEQAVNTVLTDTMKLVFAVTSGLLALGLLLTISLNDAKLYQLKKIKK